MDDGNYMTNAAGHLVPVDKVKPEKKLEDQLVNNLLQLAKHHNNRLKDFKDKCFNDIEAFMQLLSEQYGIERGGKKGNLTFFSYDGLRKVEFRNADNIHFGPELEVAKTLIDACITEWSNGANANLKVMVDKAFQVNSAGKLNTADILSLRQYNITDEKWLRAMDAISNSIHVVAVRSYVRFYERDHERADYKSITLDLASV